MTCLALLVLVMASMIACELASLRTLYSTMQRSTDMG